MKTTTTPYLKATLKMAVLLFLQIGINRLQAQCQASMSFSYGPNGLVTFSSTSTNTTANTHYYWSISSSQGPTTSTTYTANGWYTVCLNIWDSVASPACFSYACDTVIIFNVTTSSVSPCQANFTHHQGPNGSVSFNSTSTGTAAGTTYVWNFGSGLASSTNPSPNYTYTSNGLKWPCLTITNTITGCNSTFCDSVNINSIGAACNPTVLFNLSKDSTQLLTWNAYPSYPLTTTGATWNWGDGSSSTGLFPSHTYSAAGTYSICLTVSVSCSTVTAQYCYVSNIFRSTQDMSMVTVNVKQKGATGLVDQASTSTLKVFPNPSNGLFTFEISGGVTNLANITITNMLGEKVYASSSNLNETKTLDLTGLPAGYYVLNLNTGEQTIHQRLLIQK